MSAAEVIKLVDQLYGQSGDKSSKSVADKKLQSFQSTSSAWPVSLELLTKANPPEVYYFAANTLRTKIQDSFAEIGNGWQEIRDSILGILLGSTVFSKSTNSQLSVAVAHLALQCEEWNHCLLHLKSFVNPSSSARTALVVMQILQYIPEDIDSKRLELGENRRNKLKLEFSQDAPQCIDLFASLLKIQCTEREEVLLRIFKCLTSWLRADLIHTSAINSGSFCDLSFHLLKENSTTSQSHEVLTDFVCAVVQACFKQATSDEFLAKVYDGVVQLREPYIMSVAHEDAEKSMNFVTIFASTAEVFLDSIQSLSNNGIGSKVILDMLLDCCGHYDFEIALHTFNFWFAFAESISRQSNSEEFISQFAPYYERLIVSLFRLCQLEPDRSDLLSMKDDFYEFRNLARDLIMESVQIVHPMKIVVMAKSVIETQNAWESIEAAIFVLNAVAKFIHREENEVTPPLFEKVLAIGHHQTHVCVGFAVLQFLGELGTWVSNHPNFLEGIIQFLATRLSCKELNDCASSALLNICCSNAEQLAPHFDSLCELLKYFDLQKQKSSEDLIQGLVCILNHKPNPELKVGFEKLVKFCIESAANSADQHAEQKSEQYLSPESEKAAGDASGNDSPLRPYIPVLDRISILLQYVRPKEETPHDSGGDATSEHPCKQVIGQILPLVLGILHQYKMSEKISEKGCRTLRYSLRCLGLHFEAYLADLVQNLVDLYTQNGFSCYLYLGGIVVDEFGACGQYNQGLSALFDHFSARALNEFTEEDGFRNHPDTVDDFYRLSIRITQKCPEVLIGSDKFAPVFDAAICALHLDHKEALISVVEFIDTLFSTASAKNNANNNISITNSNSNNSDNTSQLRSKMSEMLSTHGHKLLTQAIAAAVFSLPRYLLPDISLVFQTVSQFDRDSFCILLAQAFEALSQRNETAAKNVSSQQLRSIYDAIVHDSNYRPVGRTLKNLVKFYR